jgi:hypothetical protein
VSLKKNPIISVIGSSGAGTSMVKHTSEKSLDGKGGLCRQQWKEMPFIDLIDWK